MLPEGPCRICGARVPAGHGTRLEPVNRGPAQPPRRLVVNGLVRDHSGQEWDRQHDKCRSEWGWVISQLLGVSVTEREALEVRELSGVDAVAMNADRVAKRKPFDWVTADELDRLTKAWDRVRPQSRGAHCVDGPCGWCGVRVAKGWVTSALKWTDATSAPLCGVCAQAWTGAGQPGDIDEQRYLAQEMFTGVPRHMGGQHHGMRVFTDVAGEDRHGFERPWSYAPEAMRELRRRVWSSSPQHAPEQVRPDLERVNRIRADRAAKQDLDAAQSTKPGADLQWGSATA